MCRLAFSTSPELFRKYKFVQRRAIILHYSEDKSKSILLHGDPPSLFDYMMVKLRVLTLVIASTILLFGRGVLSQLCTGSVTGNEGFCVDAQDQVQVGFCNNSDFAIEGDANGDCSQSTVR
jgi:hypothetical protein